MRLSGLQRSVLSLYRQCLREIQKKPVVCDLQLKESNGRIVLTFPRTYERISRVSQGRWCYATKASDYLRVAHLIKRCRTEFQRNVGLDKKDFAAIEYLLRKGQRQLEIYSSPDIRNIIR